MKTKHVKSVIDLTLNYFSKLSDREEYLQNSISYYEGEISGTDGEYDRMCKEAIEYMQPELTKIKLVKESVTNLLKPKTK
jgi:hypothetical protein